MNHAHEALNTMHATWLTRRLAYLFGKRLYAFDGTAEVGVVVVELREYRGKRYLADTRHVAGPAGIYVSGPMTGLPDLNFPEFNGAAKYLRFRVPVEVVNPAEFGEEPGKSWADYMRKDIAAMLRCNVIVMLPGWKKSKGAKLERFIARALGFVVVSWEDVA